MDDTVKILNGLIETSEDGLKGFQEAADKAKAPQLKQLFADRAQACNQSVRELQALVTSLGGKPEQQLERNEPAITDDWRMRKLPTDKKQTAEERAAALAAAE